VQVLVDGKKNEQAFLAGMSRIPEVQECHRISGEFPCLLKVWAPSLADLERFADEKIKSRAGVMRTLISIVLSSSKDHVTGLAARG
jgi:Lrp/AsnC family leucine-responsive transcriptional regulator